MRADGQINRERLIRAAEDLFAEHGTSVSVAEIVAAAGVAPPTLYRHFGDKGGLIREITERASEVAMSRLAHALTRRTGWEGLRFAVDDSIELARDNKAVSERSGVAISPALERTLLSGWEELIGRCHEEGSVRLDFEAPDVPVLFAAAATVARVVGYRPALVERYVTLLMLGLLPSDRPLPGHAPTASELRRAFTRPTAI